LGKTNIYERISKSRIVGGRCLNAKQAIAVVIALAIVLTVVSVTVLLQDGQNENYSLTVVASFYPLAYFAEQIGGENVSVRCLIPHNTEVHAWQPKPSDMVAVKECGIFVYNGAGLEPWVEEDILPMLSADDQIIVECSHDLDLITEETRHEHDTDPHTWLDPVMAKLEAEAILDAFLEADTANSSTYQANADALFERFELLDEEYSEGLANKQNDIIIVTHAAYGYLARQYDFQVEAVVGISAEEQPSASVLAGLVDTMVENDVDVLFTDPVYASEYADSLRAMVEQQTGGSVEILPLYLMTGPMDGLDYFGQQEANLENLKAGLVG
jgi:zinc transport system substrate-binding protein